MPRKQTTPTRFFYVYIMSYTSAEVKARVEAGGYAGVGEIVAELLPLVRTEYKAGQAFYRAAKRAQRNPLAYQVLVQVSNETIIDVTIKH